MSSPRIASLLSPVFLGIAIFGCGDDSSSNRSSQALTFDSSLPGPVIIGAGVAGARAAYELKKAGVYNVTVIAPTIAPGLNIVDTGLTTTRKLANGGTFDIGASLIPGTYELVEIARELGLELKELTSNLAIVRNGRPIVIDQSNPTTLYKLFDQFELPPMQATATQFEITRLQFWGYNHRDGRLYSNESRTIDQYLLQFTGDIPSKYLKVIPEILGGQETSTASAGFQESLFMMTSPKVYTLPEMQSLPVKMIEASTAKVELATVDKVGQDGSGTFIEATRANGDRVRWVTSSPVILATPSAVSAKLLQEASPEERAVLDVPMRPAYGLTIELSSGWQRPYELLSTTYGGVPEIERRSGNVKGWGLDYRLENGEERVVTLSLVRPVQDATSIASAIAEASRYLPGLDTHVVSAIPSNNPNHAPSLTPQFYRAVENYWQWIDGTPSRRVIMAGSGTNQYGMDGAAFSGKLAVQAVLKKTRSGWYY